jgi:hypothetical protein
MNTDQQDLSLAGTEPEGQTLFDELAGLVPPQRQAEYYRVIAHTRTLSPNDEMLRVLEAMGILALLTRETPAEIAAERKSLRRLLNGAALHADEVEKRIIGYTSKLESRISKLPNELEAGLDPPRIAKMLGESLRQCYQQSGLPDTGRSLGRSCSDMRATQKQLVELLHEVSDPGQGVLAQVRATNESLLRSVARKAQEVDVLLGKLEKQVWTIWMPVIAGSALLLGFFLGVRFGDGWQARSEMPVAVQSQQEPMNLDSRRTQTQQQRHSKPH